MDPKWTRNGPEMDLTSVCYTTEREREKLGPGVNIVFVPRSMNHPMSGNTIGVIYVIDSDFMITRFQNKPNIICVIHYVHTSSDNILG